MNPSPSFTFLPSPPSNPPYHNPSTTVPDLHTTLSTLKHLIHLSKSTLHTISTLLPTATATATAGCPFNSGHRIPPTALFLHHLNCPSSPAPIDLSLLHYPNSLQSSHSLLNQNNNSSFTQTHIANTDTDLCFSLDDYRTSLDSNFFYLDCPQVVTFPLNNNNNNNNSPHHMLTLPFVLSVECANFNHKDDMTDTIDGFLNTLLPSESWNVRIEIDKWNGDYPSFCSYAVLRSVVCGYLCRKECLVEWVLVNSPFYGVVIDGFMRDHILVLFRLCLKAIVKEAIGLLVRREATEGKDCFECPVLARVLMWLASQFAILYGEVNGKLFTINMVKQFVLFGSSKSLFFCGEERVSEPSGLSEAVPVKGESANGMVFVSQVAAAVAALHERSAFETRIKAIRASRSVPAYQRVQEHGYISQKADEERRKRSNYRPIIDHDGVLWQRGGNQDSNKNKSREELLAEERDYKRRRMSYRGKKMKRSTTQVMRDIIDKYMEEIKQANTSDVDADNEARMVTPNTSKANKGVPQGDRKDPASDFSTRHARSENESKEKSYYQEYHTDRRRSSSRAHNHEQRDEEKRSRNYKNEQSCEQVSHQRSKYKRERSSSVVCDEFEDRYDPYKSRDNDEG